MKLNRIKIFLLNTVSFILIVIGIFLIIFGIGNYILHIAEKIKRYSLKNNITQN